MLAQAASAQALEKQVIAGYNSKLSARVAAFKASHTGVRSLPREYGVIRLTSLRRAGQYLGVGFQHGLRDCVGQPNQVRLRGRHIIRWYRRLLGVSIRVFAHYGII